MNEKNYADSFKRFLLRQERTYETALAELKAGKRTGPWTVCFFPRLRDPETDSRKAHVFGLIDVDHARAYLSYPILGPRLRECCSALLSNTEKSAVDIFGKRNAKRVYDSIKLFSLAAGDGSVFHKVIEQFFSYDFDK
ncbi:MAG: DUF1810 family protein [Clostridia bacterium]|nr:DUF1810 family protein [Clostridia bacterium]